MTAWSKVLPLIVYCLSTLHVYVVKKMLVTSGFALAFSHVFKFFQHFFYENAFLPANLYSSSDSGVVNQCYSLLIEFGK